MSDKPAFVRRTLFDDVVRVLPEVEIWDCRGVCFDLFICAVGFEDRALEIPVKLAHEGAGELTKESMAGLYETNASDNRRNADRIFAALRSIGPIVTEVGADDPCQIQREVHAALQRLASGSRPINVGFDISAASGTFILSVLGSLVSADQEIALHVLYCEPAEYFPQRAAYDAKLDELVTEALSDGDDTSFAEQGVAVVDVNELYPGVILDSRSDHVIAIPSLRTSRLVGCLAHISDQPLASPVDSVFWILGEPPATSMKWRLDLQKRIVNHQLATMVGREVGETGAPALCEANHAQCSTRDYREILRILLGRIDERAGENIWLVNMGSKLQTVGVALAAAVRGELAILRSRPRRFNAEKYSHGVSSLWRIRFPAFNKTLNELQRIGRLHLETKIETSREGRPEG